MNPFMLAAAPTLLNSASSAFDFSSFTGWATSVLTWILSSFTSVLTWMLDNPFVFIWLIISLIGVVFVFLRRTIGG